MMRKLMETTRRETGGAATPMLVPMLESPYLSDRRAAQRRRTVRRRTVAAVTFAALILALLAWVTSLGSQSHPRSAGASVRRISRPRTRDSPERFVVRRLPFTLPFALQDAAAVALGDGRVALLGGLNATDTSTATVSVLDAHAAAAVGVQLPEAQHDAQGVLLDGRVYVFGGGQFSSYSHILSYDPASGRMTQAGSLPTPTSDAAVAAIDGTAYVVGGYDGQQALDTIVAWHPGARPQIVARLPYGLRYAAIGAGGGRLVIAGGSQDEAATAAILSFNPASLRVQRLGDLPEPITHAAAVALGPYVYVIGGRGSASDTQSSAITAIDAATGSITRVGRLPQPLSDAGAVLVGDRVWLAGGQSSQGTVNAVYELTPRAP
jgi:hypothetical protein